MKELNKAVQVNKVEVETIKKTQMEANLEMEKSRKEARNFRCTNGIQEIEERISGVEDIIEEVDTPVKENSKLKPLIQNNKEIQDTKERQNLRIIGIENEDSCHKGPENIFNKIIDENYFNLIKEMAIKVQAPYRISNKPFWS